ncbi:MAG: IS1380 family transposase [Gammaproteobacteria bacterium]|nr:MAG: IS1380 family transposase [Gammaproteobacteria bacterium]
MQDSSYDLERLDVVFDDDHSVPNAGVLLVARLSEVLGIEEITDRCVRLGKRVGAYRPGRKLLTLMHSIILGGDFINDIRVLRAGSTCNVLGHQVMAESTCGSFLRSFTFGHVKQLDRVSGIVLKRAWGHGCGPGDNPVTIDLDSTVARTYGTKKQGTGFGYTKVVGYHPLIATRAATGEILHIRQRTGSAGSGRGMKQFISETMARIRRAGATGQVTLRADSGFFSMGFIKRLVDLGVPFSITVPKNKAVVRLTTNIDDGSWTPIVYPDGGVGEVSETKYKTYRLVVRRTRPTPTNQTEMWPDWEYHSFITNREGNVVFLDADHRKHAVVELAIRDWKQGAAGDHNPSGVFPANAAWTVIAALAHNMIRWTTALGMGTTGPVVTKTVRRRYLTIPGRATQRSRRTIMHFPTNWPWADEFLAAIRRLQALPPPA